MPEESSKQEANTPPAVPRFELAPDFRVYYTNFVQTAFTPFDCSLIIGDSTAAAENNWTVKQLARIIMSPAETKLVANILNSLVAMYENQYGSIKMPGKDKVEQVGKTEGV